MTAHTRTASVVPGFLPTTARMSTSRFVVIAASFLIEAVIVLGFVSSSLGLGVAPYPDPDHGWATPAPSVVPVAPAVEATRSRPAPPPPGPRRHPLRKSAGLIGAAPPRDRREDSCCRDDEKHEHSSRGNRLHSYATGSTEQRRYRPGKPRAPAEDGQDLG